MSTPDQGTAVLSEFRYRRPGGRIGDIVVDLGFCAREVVEECVAARDQHRRRSSAA